jgi:Flp pilus assembly protein TadD
MIHVRRSSVVVSAVFLGVACTAKKDAADTTVAAAPSAAPAPADADAALMTQGTDLMYKKGDPIAAEQIFRQILQRNPSHYGAHYQLAAAVDRSGRPTEARPMWQDMLKRAQDINDTATIRLVQTRLAAPDTVSQEAMMAIGLNLLYTANNPALAVDQFRRVLAKNPTHYGATYQLAVALDRAGKRDEGRAQWQKVLAAATAIKDEKVADSARARLAEAK